jgi:hypothetical protein
LVHDAAAQVRHSFDSAAPAQMFAAHSVLHAGSAPHRHASRLATIGRDAVQRFVWSSGPAVIALQWTQGAASTVIVGGSAASGVASAVVVSESLLHARTKIIEHTRVVLSMRSPHEGSAPTRLRADTGDGVQRVHGSLAQIARPSNDATSKPV